ncbi:M56 family metallopeptidase [Iamia sp.]|uniref:M56 family metallopeptidase n=1 Tax=Iamia sp. TaxID=2722710 RepID=UPI002B9C6856|nr:M48 family metalloprotease [Iamia sp.]HXH59397.1 M48 family metalloprotease [Iamia sp.]
MTHQVFFPLLVAVTAAGASIFGVRRLQPVTAAWTLTLIAVAGGLAAASGLVIVILGFLRGVPWFGHGLAWCLHLSEGTDVVAWSQGTIAVVWSTAAIIRVQRRRRTYRALRASGSQGPEVEIVADEEPTAYSLPGRPGRIVVSASMLACLPEAEQDVLFAHERSHLRHRHDRFIHLADLAAAVLPPLALLGQRVRFATERWADEDAARELGDTGLVARAIARAALAQGDVGPPTALALARLGVRARVEDLLREPPSRRLALAALASTGVLAAVVVVSSSVQVHHLALVAAHACFAP